MKNYKIVVLDDYQNVAFESADWSVLRDRADIAVFQNHLADPEAVIERLLPFDVVCVMRERSPLPRNVIERLPNLKLIDSVRLATPLARFGKVVRTASKQRVGSSNLPGRATYLS
jgi:phosphoglycerate dehydrogenase-like enzyme